jgi:hypothetical protein
MLNKKYHFACTAKICRTVMSHRFWGTKHGKWKEVGRGGHVKKRSSVRK